MNHPTQRRTLLAQLRHQLGQRITIGHITGHHPHARARRSQLRHQLAGPRGILTATAGQHHLPHPIGAHQMTRDRRTGHPGTTGDQHRARAECIGQHRGHGQHHLADMAGLTDQSISLRGAPHIEVAHRQQLQLLGGEQPHQLAQQRSDPIRAGLRQVKCPVPDPGIAGSDHLRVADIGLTQLNKPPTGGQEPQRSIHELPGQRVEHHIHPAPTGNRPELLLEFHGARITNMVVIKTHVAQSIPLTAAGGDKHLRPPKARQRHRGHPHATGAGMNQHRLPRPQPGQIGQPIPGRQKRHRHRSGLDKRPPRRHLDQHPLIGHRQRTGPTHQPHHPIADGQPVDLRTDLDHHPRTLGTQHRVLTRHHPQRHQHIPEIDPHRAHPHPHLPDPHRRQRLRTRRHHHIGQRPRPTRGQLPRRLPRGQSQHRRGRRQPGAIDAAGAHHQLRLPARHQPDQIRLGRRYVAVDQHNPARMLGLRRTHQPPHRRPTQIGDVLPGQPHRPVSEHHQRARPIGVHPRLHHRQHRMGGGIHRTHHTLPTGRPALPHHHRTGGVGVAGFSAKVVPADHRRAIRILTAVALQGDWRPHQLQQPLLGSTSSRAHRRC